MAKTEKVHGNAVIVTIKAVVVFLNSDCNDFIVCDCGFTIGAIEIGCTIGKKWKCYRVTNFKSMILFEILKPNFSFNVSSVPPMKYRFQ